MFNDSSLKDFRGRLRGPVVTPQGNYHRSVIDAGLFVKNGSAYEADPIPVGEGNLLVVLAFLQDSPVYQKGLLRWPMETLTLNLNPGPGTVDVVYEADEQEYTAPCIGNTGTGGVSLVVTPDADYAGFVAPEREIKGTTPTGKVKVSGYLLGINASQREPRTEDPFGRVEIIAQSPILSGNQLYFGTVDGQQTFINQIILRESDYTQAIQNNQDVIDVTIGPIRYLYEVVGIWAEYIPVP